MTTEIKVDGLKIHFGQGGVTMTGTGIGKVKLMLEIKQMLENGSSHKDVMDVLKLQGYNVGGN